MLPEQDATVEPVEAVVQEEMNARVILVLVEQVVLQHVLTVQTAVPVVMVATLVLMGQMD